MGFLQRIPKSMLEVHFRHSNLTDRVFEKVTAEYPYNTGLHPKNYNKRKENDLK